VETGAAGGKGKESCPVQESRPKRGRENRRQSQPRKKRGLNIGATPLARGERGGKRRTGSKVFKDGDDGNFKRKKRSRRIGKKKDRQKSRAR